MDVELKCKICGQEFKKLKSFTNHLVKSHKITTKAYYDSYYKTESEGKCLYCNKPTKFRGLLYKPAYRLYCSYACSNLHGARFENAKNTNLIKYGSACSLSSSEIQEKAKITKLQKYNDEHYCNSTKAKQTNDNKILLKYKNCITDSDIISYNNKIFTCKCNTCNITFNISENLAYLRHFRYNTVLCTYCNPIDLHNSCIENEIANYLQNFVNVKQHDRTILSNNHELDLYIPAKNLAIEVNGLYWHSEVYKDTNYHLNKTNECEKLNIQLIHVFEDDWKYKQEIVKSRLKNLLGLNTTIYARKCKIAQVEYQQSKQFLENNHIQGNCISSIRYGLYYNDELVSLMTFGKSRFKKDEFELLRFCSKLYTNVVGGASKLFKHFLKDHPEILKIISYADRCWSIGKLYEKLEFHKTKYTIPNYSYIIDGIRYNRMSFQKKKLKKNSNMSEHEIMKNQGYYRIYDSGNIKYEYIRSELIY